MLRLGIVGTGRIVSRVMTDLHNAREIELRAVASRSLERAKATAEKYGIPLFFGSYEELADREEIDLVYIALPHPFHRPAAEMMMKKGKHVLCEKPLSYNEEETSKMFACAEENGVFLMEAMWTRFFPATKKMMQLLADGAVGEVRHVAASMSFVGTPDMTDRLYVPELAGGALLDVGVYSLQAITMILGRKPEKITGMAVKNALGTDLRTGALLVYPGGATAQFFSGVDMAAEDTLTIYGSKGVIRVPDFWHPSEVYLREEDGREESYVFPKENEGHHYEFDHAAECIRKGLTESPVMPREESIALSALCTELRRETGVRYPMEN